MRKLRLTGSFCLDKGHLLSLLVLTVQSLFPLCWLWYSSHVSELIQVTKQTEKFPLFNWVSFLSAWESWELKSTSVSLRNNKIAQPWMVRRIWTTSFSNSELMYLQISFKKSSQKMWTWTVALTQTVACMELGNVSYFFWQPTIQMT